jgi:hypothetical protein
VETPRDVWRLKQRMRRGKRGGPHKPHVPLEFFFAISLVGGAFRKVPKGLSAKIVSISGRTAVQVW